MTFFQWMTENKTKTIGWASMMCAGVLAMIALGMFGATATEPALLEPMTIRWLTVSLTIVQMALGGGTIAVGTSNKTQERVATARAEVATAMTQAFNTPAPPTQPPQA